MVTHCYSIISLGLELLRWEEELELGSPPSHLLICPNLTCWTMVTKDSLVGSQADLGSSLGAERLPLSWPQFFHL